MRTKEDCLVYEPEIKRVTKANSFVAGGRVVYVCGKDHTGKDMKWTKRVGVNKPTPKTFYSAYDKDTKILLASHWDKEYLIEYLQKKDLSCLGNTQGTLF